jgi:hypothetical protein
MAWRLAKSIKTLLDQVNAENPHRRKDSDGGIGDAAHASRGRDHNPYIIVKGMGVVRAFDFTHAPETGFDAYAFAEMMLKNKDPRVRYIISNRKIVSGKAGPSPWVWRKYTGSNAHNHHTHVSVTEDEAEFDNPKSWNLGGLVAEAAAQAPEANSYVPPPATLRIKSRGELVKRLQAGVGLKGAQVDGWFGEATSKALAEFQRAHGLSEDGIAGPQVWDAINKTAA